MLHGTIVLGIFSMDFGGKVLSHYNFSVKRYLWCTLLIRENCCSGVNKLHMEIVFYYLFLRRVQNRFYAVASGYGISSISVSVSHIKSAVWAKFTDSVT